MRLGFCHSLITQWTIPSLPSTAVTVTFTDTLGKWPRTLGLVRNDIRTCGKQKNKSSTSRWDRSIAETPRAAEKLRRAVEPGRRSKPLSTASHLHNNSWRLSPWLHCDVTICMDASRGDASSRYSQQLDFTLHMPFVKEHKCISLKHPWSHWGKLLTVAELLPPTQTNMIVNRLLYRCRCCMQEWNNQYISTNIVLFDLNGGLMSFF